MSFSQNTILLFNKSVTCFGYCFLAVTKTIQRTQKEDNTVAVLLTLWRRNFVLNFSTPCI